MIFFLLSRNSKIIDDFSFEINKILNNLNISSKRKLSLINEKHLDINNNNTSKYIFTRLKLYRNHVINVFVYMI